MDEPIVVTGAAGFIGSSLIEKLVKMNYEIVGIDRLERPVKLESVLDDIRYVELDITNTKALQKVFEEIRPIGIIHLAAVSRVIWCEHDVYRCIDTNINGTISILKTMANTSRRPWLIYGSSREVYGEPQKLPVKESDPKSPINVYGYTKAIGEKIVAEYAQEKMFSSIILRFSNVYGNEKDIHDRVIPRFVIRALKGLPLEIHGGNQIFDFTYIDDTVNGIIKAVEKLMMEDFIVDDYHILTGKPTQLRKLPKYISRIIGKEVDIVYKPPRSYDVERFYGDPAKGLEKLGFRACVSIEEGLKYTVERFRRLIL